MRVSLRLLLAPLVASVGLLAMPVPTEAQRASGSFYVGDSIGAIMQWYGLLNHDHIDSVPGRKLEEGVEVVRGFSLQPGDRLTVELGTNNLDGDDDQFALVSAIAAEIPNDICVQWVTAENFWTLNGAAFTTALVSALEADNQCYSLVRWDLLGRYWMTYDLVHPTYVGAWYLAALIQWTEEPLS